MSEHTFLPEKRPQDCFDWLTREDVTRMAMRAFEVACAGCRAPAGTRFMDDDVAWQSRAGFAHDLAQAFGLQVKNEAHTLALDGGQFEADAAMWLRWNAPAASPDASTTRTVQGVA